MRKRPTSQFPCNQPNLQNMTQPGPPYVEATEFFRAWHKTANKSENKVQCILTFLHFLPTSLTVDLHTACTNTRSHHKLTAVLTFNLCQKQGKYSQNKFARVSKKTPEKNQRETWALVSIVFLVSKSKFSSHDNDLKVNIDK